ncbi:MAG: restriction endonuclease [Methylococcales bacterium]
MDRPQKDIQTDISSITDREGLEDSISALERYISNGLFQQAAELSDQIMQFSPHLLAYFIENALEFKDDETKIRVQVNFNRSTLPETQSNDTISLTPKKMHVLLRIQLLEYQRSKLSNRPESEQNKSARACWLTAYLMGLNVRKPLPPLLQPLAEFAEKHSSEDERLLARNILLEIFDETHWQGIEQIVSLYFEAEGYDVERQFASTMSFDLIARKHGLHGQITATGVQVKHWQKPLTPKDFDEFQKKLYRTPGFEALTHLLIYCSRKSNSHNAVRDAADKVRSWYSNVQSIEFIDAPRLADRFLQSPSVLPAVLFYAKNFQNRLVTRLGTINNRIYLLSRAVELVHHDYSFR